MLENKKFSAPKIKQLEEIKMNYKRSSFILGKQKGKLKPFSTNIHKREFWDIVKDVIQNSDIILEILDSRFIDETRNLEVENLIKGGGKKIIYVLNKADLSDMEKIKKHAQEHELFPYAIISCKMRRGSQLLRNRIKIESKKINKEKILVGVIGYPNVGKSSIINLLIGKSSAKTAFEAGFTKVMQKIKLMEGIFIIDTPGVVPSEEKDAFIKHVKIGSRNYDKVREPELVVASIMKEYPNAIEKFYKIKSKDPDEFFEKLGRKKCLLKKHGEIDIDRTARLILRDWQEGRIKT